MRFHVFAPGGRVHVLRPLPESYASDPLIYQTLCGRRTYTGFRPLCDAPPETLWCRLCRVHVVHDERLDEPEPEECPRPVPPLSPQGDTDAPC